MSAANGLCDSFRDLAGRTFRCTDPYGHTGQHSGIAGTLRQSWDNLARGAMGASYPASVAPLPAPVAPLVTEPRYPMADPHPIPSVGPAKVPYPGTGNLAVPGSAVPPVENGDVSLVGRNYGPIQEPYVELPTHMDGPGYGNGEMPDLPVLHPPIT